MTGWIKLAIVLAGAATLGGVVAVFGLPANIAGKSPAVNAPAPSAVPAPAPLPQAAAPAAPAPQQEARAVQAEPPKAAAPATPAPAPEPTVPSFDIVRVEPTGEVILAGRGHPGATVELLRNSAVHEKAVVGSNGQFAMVPPNLAPGTHELVLAQVLPDGRRSSSKQSVTVVVSGPGTPAMVALAAPDRPTEILSAQGGSASTAPKPVAVTASAAPAASAPAPAAGPVPGGPRRGVALSTVETEEGGRLYATGTAQPGATVRLYLNDTYLATATASPEGRWSFTVGRGVAPGSYKVRADEVEPASGRVLSRAEVPFDFSQRIAAAPGAPPPAVLAPAPAPTTVTPGATAGSTVAASGPPAAATAGNPPPSDVVVAEVRTTTVVRGDSLWRISKRVYGKGLRYTVIYDANQPQIQDPNRIYPGQQFVLPGEKKT